jgi:SAM-dependent methyltransferase
MKYTGERAIPWESAVGVRVMHAHIARYTWALPWCADKRVIDLGCGAGYGAFLLSFVARNVIGLDIEEEAVQYARDRFQADNLSYAQIDITQTYLTNSEVWTCFEVIEHLEDPEMLLAFYHCDLRYFLWSIPVEDGSQFHKWSYTVDDIHTMMRGSEFYYQDDNGVIVPEARAWFEPVYVLGVRGCLNT